MAPGDIIGMIIGVLNALGLLPVVQVAVVVMAAIAVARWFLSRS